MILTHGANSLVRGKYVEIGGRKYPVVKIGNRLWMAENLDYKSDGIIISTTIADYTPYMCYYNNDESTYGYDGNKCGALYNVSALWYINNLLNSDGFAPTGWRIATKSDYQTLIDYAGGGDTAEVRSKLKSNQLWDIPGTNDLGFSLLPNGAYDSSGFGFFGTLGALWTATEYSSYQQYIFFVNNSNVSVSQHWDRAGFEGIRLVKDAS